MGGGVDAGGGAGEHTVLIDADHHARGIDGFGSGGAKAELESHVMSCRKVRKGSDRLDLGIAGLERCGAKPFILSHVENPSP